MTDTRARTRPVPATLGPPHSNRRVPRVVSTIRSRSQTPPRWWEELLLIALSYWLYGLIRNGVPEHTASALQRAVDIRNLEHALHIDFELAVNKAVASVHWLVITANYYYATLHFLLTAGVLVWLYVRRRPQYRGARTVLVITNLVALIGFWAYPLAPPRMLGEYGYIDTVVVFDTWGSWASGDVASASNQYAAMPSLHFAWSLWCALIVITFAASAWVRVLAALYPVLTLAVIVATANHFVLDAVGGALVLALGFAGQRLLFGPAGRMPVVAPVIDHARPVPSTSGA